MTYDHFELFEAYTNRTLSDTERQELDFRLNTDDDLQAEFRDYKQFRHSIEAVKFKGQLERIHNRLEQNGELTTSDRPPMPLKPTVGRRKLTLWAVPIILLLIGGAYWFSRPTLAEQTFVAYYEPEPVSRGAATCSADLMPGIQAYRAQQYEQALQLFTQLPAQQSCVAYYIGLTQLALNQEKEAIKSLTQASVDTLNVPTLVRQKAEWYLALSFLKADQGTEAQQQLKRITQQPDQPFRNVALRALAKLENE